jgi:hypothetical protein
MWNVRRRISPDPAGAPRGVALNYTGFPATYRGARKFWLTLERSGVDLGLSDPGFEIDLYVDADIAAMTKVWLGDLSFAEAVRARKIRLAGTPALIRQFPSWLPVSRFAGVPRPQERRIGV